MELPQTQTTPARKACCTPSKPAAPSATLASREGRPAPADTPPQLPGALPLHEPIPFADAGSTDHMVRLDGSAFLMGSENDDIWKEDGEAPVREVTVKPFYLDACAVTNEQFAAFIDATGYVTEAESFGWSFVFHTHLPRKFVEKLRKTQAVQGLEWWLAVPGAKWDRPYGQRSDLKGRMQHPAVHVSWNDAMAYAKWAGKRLPTEAEWEFAARGGREQNVFPWGDQLTPRGRFMCNTWQGRFPLEDSADDGFAGTCPVDAFKPNAYGLYNTNGNVWEWCADWFSPDWHTRAHDDPSVVRADPVGPPTGTHKMQKGGSYLCHVSYCNRYRTAARTGNTPDSSTTNNGFRCARDA